MVLGQSVFTDTSLVTIDLTGNFVEPSGYMTMDGVDQFIARRLKNKDKALAGGAWIDHGLFGSVSTGEDNPGNN